MKFEMSATEFSTFTVALAMAECAKLAKEHEQAQKELETELFEARNDRDDAWRDLENSRSEARSLREDNHFINDELARYRDKVNKLTEQLEQLEAKQPDRKERALSRMFECFNQGQKIQAIKALRESIPGTGLKDAKETIEGTFAGDDKTGELTALSVIFKTYAFGHLTDLASRLKPYVHSKLTDGDLESILTGKFHTLADQGQDIKF